MKNVPIALKIALPLIFISNSFSVANAADEVELKNSGLELTVTANRRAQNADETLSAISVVTREDIERTKATTVAEVLSAVPGVNISNSGGLGKATSVFIRGANSGHTLVLIDGVRHGSATLGTTSFQHLPVSQIERIEIVRGPRSSQYGSDAIGGVIQIFTRKGQRGFQPSIEVSAGSNNTFNGVATLSGGNDKTTYNITAQSLSTDGIDACNSTTAGCFADEPDDDGYDQESISLNLKHEFSDKFNGQVSILRSEGDTEFDGGFQNEADFVQQVINAKLNANVSDKLNISFSVGRSQDESDNFLDGVFTGDFNTKRDTVSLVTDYSINSNNNLLVGVDYYDDVVSGNTDYDVSSRNNKGVFASYTGQFNRTQLSASLRNDDNEQFGTETTGGLALGYKINDSLNFRVSYGTAFNAPTFNQLYFPGFGNADLLPEESKNYEIGLDGSFGNSNWSLNFFQNDIDNLIAGFPVGNIDEARIRGIEAEYSTKLGNFDISTNLTFQEPEVKSGENDGKTLRSRPERILNINLDRKFGRFSIGSTIHAESERFADAANTDALGGYTRLDLRADYDVSKNWTVGLKVENALDKDYSLNKGFNQDGVSGLLTLKYAPK